jgi:Tfp pilus assembly protein PilF
VAAIGGLWLMRKRTRAPLAAALFFGGSLFPVIGFFNVFAFIFSFVADHWQYLPSIGVVVLVAAGVAGSPGPAELSYRKTAAVLLVAALGILTFHQSRMYADMRTFYRTTLARNPEAWMAHNNLGNLLREDKDPEAAVPHFEAALRVRPDLVKVHNNLANALHDLRRVPEAMEHYRQALKLDPLYIEAHHNLGNLLRETKQLDEAIFHLQEAVRLDPKYIDAHNSLGVALREAGRGDEAIASFERALKLAPNFAPAHLNLALSYSLAGRETEAAEQFREARRLNPAIPDVFGR